VAVAGAETQEFQITDLRPADWPRWKGTGGR